ncbi:MAG: gamma-glutamyltransferase, partial [Rhodospirillaceae bacterium]|nr:gamma-glutamyltransferase [Rhodospirillaceae bacterium]
MRRIAFTAMVLMFCASGTGAQSPAPEHPSGWRDKTSLAAKKFMVAAANPHAARAGYDVLARGGSAMDAAVAVQAMLNLVEPQS